MKSPSFIDVNDENVTVAGEFATDDEISAGVAEARTAPSYQFYALKFHTPTFIAASTGLGYRSLWKSYFEALDH